MNAQTTYGSYAGTQGGITASYFGYNAGKINTGRYNSFIGYKSGSFNEDGEYNTFLGAKSGHGNAKGIRNTFIGYQSGYNNLGDGGNLGNNNTFLGANAGYKNKDGSRNTLIGTYSGYNNIDGEDNTFLGYRAGYKNSEGDNNTCIGRGAGYYSMGSGNVFIGRYAGFSETGSDKLYIDNSSNNSPLIYGDFSSHYVGIAIDPTADIVSPNSYGLYVGKGILAEKVKVATRGTANWADYVFEPDYDLNSLEEVENFIKTNKHLPNVPSEAEVNKNGVDMVEMDATLLRQIEELWLHVIKLKKDNDTLRTEVKTLKSNKK